MADSVNLRAQRQAVTRERVLTAARAAFEQKGYEDATVRLIARAAGLSTGAVFSNFTDKAALYTAVYGHRPVSQEEARGLLAEVAELRVAARSWCA